MKLRQRAEEENWMTDKMLSLERRQDVFAALVNAQHNGLPVRQSRKLTSERFGIREGEVRLIEREGLDNNWPPL
jgi:hypothetical protein